MPTRYSQRRASRPIVEGLETREMLSMAGAMIHAASAEVHIASRPAPKVASFLQRLGTPLTVSTVPDNGDQNPYGVAFVPAGFPTDGAIHPGDILVSNFNNGMNLQGTGTTIVRVTPQGNASTFFQGSSGLGLTTALGVLRSGFVLVGNVPTTDGSFNTIQQGSLLVLDRNGNLVANLANSKLLDGPWDLTIDDRGRTASIFVSNVLSGTVSRFDVAFPRSGSTPFVVTRAVQIASGYTHRGDPAALALGPTGLAYDPRTDTLYVASTADNAIFAITHAEHARADRGRGILVYQDNAHLRGPLGLVLAPNGNLITSNGDAINADPNQNSELVEFTPRGRFVSQLQVDPEAGGAFGLAISPNRNQPALAAVDDVTASLNVYPIF
jgi:DNA-binding beta-propeller fold protein YncE